MLCYVMLCYVMLCYVSLCYVILCYAMVHVGPMLCPSIHPLIHGLSARWCPMFPHFLTSWVSRLFGLALVSWATTRVGVHRLSLRLPYSVFFHSLFFTCHWIPFVFLLYGRPIRSTLHLLTEFPGLGLALVPDVVVPEAGQRCAWSRNLNPNFCPSRGRTLDLGI